MEDGYTTFAGALVWFGDSYHQTNVIVHDKQIVAFSDELKGEIITLNKNYVLSPNFIDMHTHLRYPNAQNDPTVIQHETQNALRGGYGLVCSMANTVPVLDTKEALLSYQAMLRKYAQIPVLCFSALTKGLQGEALVDINSIKPLVIGFSDDGHGVDNYHLVAQATEQLVNSSWLISMHAQRMAATAAKLQVNEKVAQRLGQHGFTVDDEAEQIKEHLAVISSQKMRYHVAHLSCEASLAYYSVAKQMNPWLSAEVTPHHLICTEDDVLLHNGTFKVNPPLRSENDRQAMIAGLKSKMIDIIASDHAPHSYKTKTTSLAQAKMGFVSLPIMFGLLYHYLVLPGFLTLTEVLKALTVNPAKLLHIEHQIRVGQKANFVVLNLAKEWIITPEFFGSGCYNTPFLHKKVQGFVTHNVVNGIIHAF